MISTDLHIHTSFCDGKNSPEEIVLEAIDKNLSAIGFSGHSYTFFDESYCMSKEDTSLYKEEVNRLKEKYKNEIKIYTGVEQDFYSDESVEDYDYVIGSVHYVKAGDAYIPVDESAEILRDAVDRYFNNDVYLFCKEYFSTVSRVVDKTHANLIGHFDLISKFNEKGDLFNEDDERYVSLYKKTIDRLICCNVPFEVNTGAISRGYRSFCYPSEKQIEYIIKNNGRFTLSSDCHEKHNLAYKFNEFEERLRNMGYCNFL